MRRSSTLATLLFALALLGAALVIRAPTQMWKDAVGDAALPSAPASLPTPWPRTLPDADGAFAAGVRLGPDLRSALLRARGERAPDDLLLLSLTDEVRVACAVIKHPDAAFARVEDDPNRSPWRNALAARCSGIVEADLQSADWTAATWARWEERMASAIGREQGAIAAIAAARAHLAQSPEPRVLADALRYLIRQNALPANTIFAVGEIPARTDLEAIALIAADWIACERAGACGTTGLATLSHCTQFGCPAGSDLQQALLRTLPRMQFEATRRLVRWALEL